MRNEDAIKLLEQIYKWSLDWDDREDGLDYCDAIQAAISALRAQHTQLDRSRWTGCDNCTAGDGEFRHLLEKWGDGDYCSRCGRPLTEQAWVELERRVNGGTAD